MLNFNTAEVLYLIYFVLEKIAEMKAKLSTRTTYSVKNATVAMATKILAIVFGYFARMVFTRTLSMQYVGLNGLYTNIIGALNVAEFGIGTALVYALYEPVAKGNISKQRALLKLFDRVFAIIASISLLIGIVLCPVLLAFIKTTIPVRNLIVIYALFLSRAILSYFLMYRSTIFIANQRSYVNDLCDSGFLVLQNLLQIIVLLLTKKYYFYLVLYVLGAVGRNVVIYYLAGKEYPEVFHYQNEKLEKEEEKGIYRNMRAMLMHKMGNTMIGNIDNLTLTAIVGIASVGIYSNYFLIIGSIQQILERIVYAISGSVGNLGATEDKNHVKEVFLGTFLLVAIGYSTASIVLSEMLDVFVEASFGAEYVFPRLVTVVLCINLFLNGLRQASLIFRDSLGLFWHDRYKTIIESLVNLVFSIILAKRMGAAGVFIGTFISIVGVSMWIEPIVLYQDYFKAPVSEYFQKLIKYVILYSCSFLLVHYLNQIIPWSNDILRYFGMIVVSLVVPLLILGSINAATPEMRFVIHHLKPLVKKEETV